MSQLVVNKGPKRSLGERFTLHLKKYWILHLMAFPALLSVLVFHYLPLFGLTLAFQDFNVAKGFFGSEFVGLKNFEFLFTTKDAWRITRNTVLYNVVFILTNTLLSMGLAMLFNELYSKKLAKSMQTMLIMPYFLSTAVVAIIVYGFLAQRGGYVNKFMELIGGRTRNWYTYRPLWPFLLVLINAWKGVGYNSVVYMATISGISEEYYEAAVLDGATKWQQAKYITIPHLRQILCIMLILNIGSLFSGDFGLFHTVTQNNGMLYPVTDIIDTYVYRALTSMNNVNMSAAAGFYQSFMGLILILASNAIIRKIDPESALF